MKGFVKIITALCLLILIPLAMATGQDVKKEKKIKIIVWENGNGKIVPDTLIIDQLAGDTIITRDGRTLRIIQNKTEKDETGKESRYIVTTESSGKGGDTREIRKEITVISKERDDKDIAGHRKMSCEDLLNQGKDQGPKSGDLPAGEGEKTRYIINRNGMVITIEGSDFEKVRILKDEIESTLNTREEFKKEKSE